MANIKQALDQMQKKLDILYKEYGAIEPVIDIQAGINALRHKEDIHDEKQVIYTDPDKNKFVQ